MAWGGQGGYRFDLRQGAGVLPEQDCESLVAPYDARAARWYSKGAGGATTQLLGYPVEVDPETLDKYGSEDLLAGLLETGTELDLIRVEVERARKELAAKEAALARGEDVSRWTSSWQIDEMFRSELSRLRRRQAAIGARGPELIKKYETLDLERERLRKLLEDMEEEEISDRAKRKRDFERLEDEHRRRLEKMEEDLLDWENKLKNRKAEIERGLQQVAAYPHPHHPYPQHPYPPPPPHAPAPGPAHYHPPAPPPPVYTPPAPTAPATPNVGVPGGALPASLPLQLEQNQEALSFLALGLLGGKKKKKSKDAQGPILPPKPPQPAVAWVVDWKGLPEKQENSENDEEVEGDHEDAEGADTKGSEEKKQEDDSKVHKPRGASADAGRKRMEWAKARAEALKEAAKEAEIAAKARKEAEADRRKHRSPPPKSKPLWSRKPSPPTQRTPPEREFGRDAKGLAWRLPSKRDESELTGRSGFLPTSVVSGVTTSWAVRAS